jgi:hypothetical protein
MRGTEVTIPGVCVEDDGGKVFGKLSSCGAEFDSVRVDSVGDELAEAGLLGLCKISVFQSSTADAWYVRLL